ncbi:LLM class flavin-dependent oxidoreductase [Nibrella saemangeumensis]|uniref:LLM class flavin-dependent oxidoreductase n=1 Tax=Nibrella saemangeumensis TaxID=1084526 RepID=A0ABP8NC72_9BACT
MKIGLLEFGSGCESPLDIVENVLNYAERADELGFTRFWLAENYVNYAAYGSPEVLVPIIAGLTSQIRVGVAGVLMAYHNPYRVASAFKVLSSLFPDRIDLGVAKGSVPADFSALLQPDIDLSGQAAWAEAFKRNSTALHNYLNGGTNADKVIPVNGSVPTLWSLTVSLQNVSALARLNTSLCRSVFHNRIDDHKREAEKLAQYRIEFYEHHQREPEITISVAGVCAETTQEAQRIRAGLREPSRIEHELIGSPTYIFDELSALKEIYDVDEFIFMNMAEEPAHKLESLELIAGARAGYAAPVNADSGYLVAA